MGKSLAIALAAAVSSVGSAQYTVEILHSPLVPAASSYGAGAGGGQQVGHTNLFLAGPSHALLWEGTAKSLIDLHPAGWDASYAMGTDGKRQVGWRERHTGQTGQFATMWSGTAKSWVDLHNPAFFNSAALGIRGNEQVGAASVEPSGQIHHAVLWRGTAKSIVDLNPVGSLISVANATDGKQQVGETRSPKQGSPRAALWNGTPESYVDLHPAGYEISEANGVGSGQQAGFATFDGNGHAMLWFGSNKDFVDLNPGPDKEWGSVAYDTNGTTQVGHARRALSHRHAALWQGTAMSYTNLHLLLPVEYQGAGAFSEATGIDEFGNIVGWATHLPTGANHAVLWQPVPEASTLTIFGTFALFVIVRLKRGAR
jgi:hypothetical protein